MERVAVIGSGVAGLGCAWNLRDVAKVTLFEQADRPGGHTNTVTVKEDGRDVPIDTGFIVFNEVTYPHLCRLFDELGVATEPSQMSFSVQHLPDGLEYNGMSVRKVFAQWRNLVRPRFHRLLGEIGRFFEVANASLEVEVPGTVREWARANGFSRDLLDYYLVPMSSAVWSTRPEDVMDFPAGMLIRFFYNHGFLGVKTHHPWFTVSRGAQSYVRKIIAGTAEPRLGAKVVGVDAVDGGAEVRTSDGEREKFDRVIVATHGDQALELLDRPTDDEARLLGEFRYQRNHAMLHTDERVMPKRRVAWASWNYRIEEEGKCHAKAQPASAPGNRLRGEASGSERGNRRERGFRATTHYWMNALQNVSPEVNYFVSINGEGTVRPDLVLYETEYDHPTFTLGAVAAQKELGGLNRRNEDQRVFFCGSYFRYGFHEDAYWSAVKVSEDVKRVLRIER
ncbi:MAG: FAD-dependent oxidoreductase [Chthoniobacterales bacterium]